MGVLDGCLIDEALAYGCTGISSAIRISGIAVNKINNTKMQALFNGSSD